MERRWLKLWMVIGMSFLQTSICLAAGGKVTYPDGTPAAGARVNLVTLHASDASPLTVGPPHLPQPQSSQSQADQHTQVKSQSRSTITCDANGRFSFPDQALTHAMVQIKAPDKTDFATVTLPALVFKSGEVAIVLQKK